MVVNVPVYVTTDTPFGHRTLVHRCRPLFFEGPETRDESLGRAMNRLRRELGVLLRGYGEEPRHDALAASGFAPPIESRQHRFAIDLRKKILKCRLLFVSFSALGRRIAFTPSLPRLWFDVDGGGSLEETAERRVGEHVRRLVEHEGWTFEAVAGLVFTRRAWVAALDLHVDARHRSRPQPGRELAALSGGSSPGGAAELERVGRCLDWLYPDGLDPALLRDEEVARLVRLLNAPDRRPVALVGAHMAGKTAVVHGAVRERVASRRAPYENRRNVWLLSPQRLISGMSIVGQWEERLLGILREAGLRDHVLYFDDFLGLYRAGATADSPVTAADVLKPHVRRRDVRVLAEMTPEAFRVLAERDRGLADELHVLRIEPTDAAATGRILSGVRRRLEIRDRCAFDADVLPAVVDLQRRYVRDAEFPGKGAAFLNHLALKNRGSPVTRDTVHEQFHERTGLALALLDGRRKLARRDVLAALRQRVVGQDAAIEALADVVSVAKARLNAADRPLAALLLLGPTGVGKTQCARALAAFLFGHEDNLVRLDMNEFNAPGAAERLTGSFHDPEGLLTAAVRRQPYCVVLLDEIEKAHHDVFDLLLQVLGEGRLTDAAGRTTDFGNAIVVLTSNLGVREVDRTIGFRRREEDRQRAFVAAAEAFFRPEFVNRLDRIVPFRRLSRDDVRAVAQQLLADIVRREGFVSRRCALHVDARALDLLVDDGYQPQLGARALKRVIERRLMQPVAAQLAARAPGRPAVVDAYARQGAVAIRTAELVEAPPIRRPASPESPRQALQRLGAIANRLTEDLGNDRPPPAATNRTPGPAWHDHGSAASILRRIRHDVTELAEANEPAVGVLAPHAVRRPERARTRLRDRAWAERASGESQMLREVMDMDDVRAYMRGLHTSGVPVEDAEDRLASLRARVALMQSWGRLPDRTVLFLRGLAGAAEATVTRLLGLYRDTFARDPFGSDDDEPGLLPEVETVEPAAAGLQHVAFVSVSCPGAGPLVRGEAGTHLVVDDRGHLLPIQVGLAPAPAANGEAPTAAALRESFDRTRRTWLDRLARGDAALDDDPFPPEPVVRVYDARAATVDVRTGLSTPGWPSAAELQRFLWATLTLADDTE